MKDGMLFMTDRNLDFDGNFEVQVAVGHEQHSVLHVHRLGGAKANLLPGDYAANDAAAEVQHELADRAVGQVARSEGVRNIAVEAGFCREASVSGLALARFDD